MRINATIGEAALEDGNPLSRTAPTAPAAEDKWQTEELETDTVLCKYNFNGIGWNTIVNLGNTSHAL